MAQYKFIAFRCRKDVGGHRAACALYDKALLVIQFRCKTPSVQQPEVAEGLHVCVDACLQEHGDASGNPKLEGRLITALSSNRWEPMEWSGFESATSGFFMSSNS